MDFVIRPVRPGETDAVGELTARVYLDGGLLGGGADDPYLTHLKDARGRAEHAELLVAVDPGDGALLGAVAFVGDGGRYADLAGPGEAEFRMLVVDPDARGRGVGEALVRRCLELAKERGRSRILLSTQQIMHAAHRLYERLGFVRLPERDWHPEPNPTLLLLVYVLDL
ncbi:Mycothiol acetyltransferase [Streptomyces sp. RB5]|uniref:Mycothiol acetyltransferase n=1 Tax=Streptomyces smaragdinus TaxID=2585196 RepID=A0A7K0CJF4_9ACTN|nr:GNAT family N-acetyltransferase [Streptomyces smaragdinus]MQY13610.1 Mycothiol acetyltransferase [Streptomyces smaragdinus]